MDDDSNKSAPAVTQVVAAATEPPRRGLVGRAVDWISGPVPAAMNPPARAEKDEGCAVCRGANFELGSAPGGQEYL